MPYIGNSPGTGTRNRFIYTATASQTTFSGADDNGKTLKYSDSDYVDVYLNGICLVPVTDYTSTSKTSIVLTQAASLNDTLEVVAYDIATISDTVSKADGGTFEGNVTFGSGADIITETLGTDNVRIGENAGDSIASGGNQNVVIGKDAGTALTTGDSNTFIGAKVGDAITTSSGNVAIGGDATFAALGSDTQGKFTTAIGVGALRAQNFTSDTQTNNTAIGYFAGGVMTTGTANTFVGSLAGDDCVDGIQNVAVGYNALSADAGNNNTAVGESALTSTTGLNNTAIGNGAGNAITTGTKNTIVGMYNGNENGQDIRTQDNRIVLSDGDGVPQWHYNPTSYSGLWAAPYNGNTSTGRGSGSKINVSSGAVAYDGNFHITDGVANNCFFGLNNASAYVMTNSNGVLLSSGGTSWSSASDERLKNVTGSYTNALDDVDQINPVKFTWKADSESTAQVGVTAQSVQPVVPEAIDTFKQEDDDTEYMSVRYTELIPIMIAALKEAKAKIETLETKVAALEAE